MKKQVQDTIWQFTAMRYVIFGMVFLIPLWVGGRHLFPFTTPKALLVIFGAVVLSLLYLWGNFQKKESPVFYYHPMHSLIALFMGSLTLSALLGSNPSFSFFGSLIDGTGLNSLFASIIVGLSVAFVVRNDRTVLKTIAWISLVATGIMVIGAFMPVSFPSTSGGSTLGNTSYAAAYFILHICIAVALLISSTTRSVKIVAGLFTALLLFAPTFFNRMIFIGQVPISDAIRNPLLFAGVSNGASIALIVTIGVGIGAWLLVTDVQRRTRIVGGFLLGTVLIGFIGFWTLFQTPGNPINDFFVERKSNNRLIFWDIAKQGIQDRPLLGWGMNNYAYVFQEKFTPVFFSKNNVPELWTNNPHNMVWEYGVNQGIFGLGLYLVIFLGMLFFAIRESYRDRSKAPWLIAGVAGLVGYFIQNLFIFDTPATTFIFWVVIGSMIGLLPEWKTVTISEKYRYVFQSSYIIGGIVLIVLLPTLVFLPWKESREWVVYSNFSEMARRTETPQGISRLGYASDTAYIAGRLLEIVQQSMGQKITQQQGDQFLASINNLIIGLEAEVVQGPDNFRARWTLGQLVNFAIYTTGQATPENITRGRIHIERAIAMNPENAFTYLDLAQSYLLEGNIAQAREIVLQTIALAPEHVAGYTVANNIQKQFPDTVFGQKIKELQDIHQPAVRQ